MSTLKIYPLSPSEPKNCPEQDVFEKKRDLAKKFLEISQKFCHASIDIYIYAIFCTMYSLQNCVHEVSFILGHPVVEHFHSSFHIVEHLILFLKHCGNSKIMLPILCKVIQKFQSSSAFSSIFQHNITCFWLVHFQGFHRTFHNLPKFSHEHACGAQAIFHLWFKMVPKTWLYILVQFISLISVVNEVREGFKNRKNKISGKFH